MKNNIKFFELKTDMIYLAISYLCELIGLLKK